MSKSIIGKKLRQARLARKLSQAAFGAAVGKSKQLVSAWEHNRAEIQVKDLLSLVKAFDLDLADLLGMRQTTVSDKSSQKALNAASKDFDSYWGNVEPTLSRLINSKLRDATPSMTAQLKAIKLLIAALNQLGRGRR